MATGDSGDIVGRVKQVLPRRWWSFVAPIRDALLGGIADGMAWAYGFYVYAKLQTRLATATGPFLDLISFEFLARNLPRTGRQDDAYRALIKATILQERVTRKGMIQIITAVTGNAPWIFEPWNTGDTGAWSGPGGTYGSMGYGVGHGGYGNMKLPAMVFVQVKRGAFGGVPNVDGYGNPIGGYGVGAIEYIGSELAFVGLTNAQIYQAINLTKPTGVAVWVAFNSPYPD